MKTPLSACLRSLLLGSLIATSAFAQSPAPKLDFPAASPKGTVKQRVGLTDIEVEYSRPGVKGRKIFGGLEAYGQVWRTGANAATKVTFSTPVKIGGTDVPAGSYGLFSIPGESEWTVILNRIGEREWGAYSYKPDSDVVRVKAKPVTLSQPVETFTIDINDIRNESATLNLIWDKTKVSVPFQVDVVSNLKPKVDELMTSAGDRTAGQYFSAAMFYFENNLDLDKALEWIDAGLKKQPDAFYMVYRKGLILEKKGDKAGALAAAQASREAALSDKRESLKNEYLRLNDALIARLK